MAVFGCTGGVLALEAHDGDYEDIFVAAPAGSPEDFRLTSVWGYPGLDHFFALGSAVGLYLVEPEEGEMEQLIPATESLRPIQVALSYDGELLLVVMSDGELRMYEAHDLDLLASASGFPQRRNRSRLLGAAPHRHRPRPYLRNRLQGRRSHRPGRPRPGGSRPLGG